MEIFGSLFNIIKTLTTNEILKRALNTRFDNVSYSGVEKIPKDRKKGYIIIANHSHYLDYTIMKPIVDCYCVASLSEFIVDNLPNVNYEDEYNIIRYDYSKESGAHVKQRILSLINEGKNVLIFPEGAEIRSSPRSECLLKPFKSGLFKLAFEHNIDILPVSQNHLDNNSPSYFDSSKTEVLFEQKSNIKVNVTVHDIIHPSDHSNVEELIDFCRSVILTNL